MKTFLIVGLLMVAANAAAQPVPDESDPLIAAVIVYSTSYAIERWESYCIAEVPSSATSIEISRASWMDSHSNLLSKAAIVLKSQYSKEERVQIAVQARLTNDELENKLSAAPASSRQEWCEQSSRRILAPQMDLNRRQILTHTLQDFTP